MTANLKMADKWSAISSHFPFTMISGNWITVYKLLETEHEVKTWKLTYVLVHWMYNVHFNHWKCRLSFWKYALYILLLLLCVHSWHMHVSTMLKVTFYYKIHCRKWQRGPFQSPDCATIGRRRSKSSPSVCKVLVSANPRLYIPLGFVISMYVCILLTHFTFY